MRTNLVHYRPDTQELTQLGGVIEGLGRVVHDVCRERSAMLEADCQGGTRIMLLDLLGASTHSGRF